MKKFAGLLSLVVLVSGCVTQRVAPDPSILRVGISPNSQPVAFKQGGVVSGIEADFAQLLGKELGRKVVYVEVPWKKQIEFVEKNKTDIIMSGMTVTGARSIRIDFSNPYMQSGMSALFRRSSYDPSGLLASSLANQNKRIGFVKGTTGEMFVYQRFPRGEKKEYATASAAVSALKSGKLDMFIHDAPMVWWLYARNESDLVAFPDVLNIEPVAWGLRKGNTELLDQVNAALAKWEKDGTSKSILRKWIPITGQ